MPGSHRGAWHHVPPRRRILGAHEHARCARGRVSARGPVRVGVDTGGTFTDVVVAGPAGLRALKVPSTPDDPSRAILAGLDAALDAAAADSRVELVHGTTVGT